MLYAIGLMLLQKKYSDYKDGVVAVAESDSSELTSTQVLPEHLTAKESLKLWDSLYSMRLNRGPCTSARPIRVLLAEDNPIDQICIRRLLEKQRIEVVLAGDGRLATEIFQDSTFDLVLLDVLMPEMDGFEVATYIRAYEKMSGGFVPIIALTAYSLKAVYDKCRSVGMNGYLSKPVAGIALHALLSVLLTDSAELSQ